MTTSTRQRMTGPQRREQLLDVTKAIVAADGVTGVSIEAVARRAGITRPIVYDHFGGLDELLARMLERETARALAQLGLHGPAPDASPHDALLGALRTYLEAVAADPVTWRLVLLPPEGLPAMLRELVTGGREAVLAGLTGLVGDRSPDPALTARTMQAVAEEAARQLLTDPEAFPVDRLLAHAAWLLEALPER